MGWDGGWGPGVGLLQQKLTQVQNTSTVSSIANVCQRERPTFCHDLWSFVSCHIHAELCIMGFEEEARQVVSMLTLQQKLTKPKDNNITKYGYLIISQLDLRVEHNPLSLH